MRRAGPASPGRALECASARAGVAGSGAAEPSNGGTRNKEKPPIFRSRVLGDKAPGSDLLSHGLSHTTIGAGAFHFRVRDGIGWYHAAVSAREAVKPSRSCAPWTCIGLGRNKVCSFIRSMHHRGKATSSYMIKPHGSLVSVSSALLRYTPDLSTT